VHLRGDRSVGGPERTSAGCWLSKAKPSSEGRTTWRTVARSGRKAGCENKTNSRVKRGASSSRKGDATVRPQGEKEGVAYPLGVIRAVFPEKGGFVERGVEPPPAILGEGAARDRRVKCEHSARTSLHCIRKSLICQTKHR